MPIYESKEMTREQLFELRKVNRCKVCHGMLNVFLDRDTHLAYLTCNSDRAHEGIEREALPPFEPNLATWRSDMEQELGKDKAAALAKYYGKPTLQKVDLQDVVERMWPEAPAEEKVRAIMLCASYGLNPLAKHVFLIPFNQGEPNETWATVMGIKAKRLLANRRGAVSYMDGTPRVMTKEEQMTTFGEVLTDRLYVITRLRDPKTGAEAPGYGFWFHKDKPKGEAKGNTRFNMAAIRSESQALDRLRPGEMPQGIETVEESTIEGEYSAVDEGSLDKTVKPAAGGAAVPGREKGQPENKGTAPAKQGGRAGESADAPPAEGETENAAGAPPAEDKIQCAGFTIDKIWLDETLKILNWSEVATRTFLVSHYKVDSKGTISEVLQRLTREQAENFTKELNGRLGNQQKLL